jgi:hypothetical protein
MELSKDDILTQLLVNNYAGTEQNLFEGKKKVKFRTLTADAQMAVEEIMTNLPEKTSRMLMVHTYAVQVLARSLVKYGDKTFDPDLPEETLKFIKKLPSQIVDILNKLGEEFRTEVLKISAPKELEKYFFPMTSSGAEPNSSSEGLISKDISTPQQN